MTSTAAHPLDQDAVEGSPEAREYFSVRAAVTHSLRWLLHSASRIAQAWIPESWLVVIMYVSKPISRWLWSRWWSRLLIRVAAGWHALGALLVIFATPAAADPSGGGGASPFFAWMALKDTHGIDAWSYFLSIDKGNASMGGGWRMIWAYIITLEYEVFRFMMATAIWFITYALSFDWIEMILTPVRTIADSVTSITDQFALTPLMLTIAGFSVAVWFVRGRFSTGIYELLMSCVIAAAAAGFLANPLDRVVGNEGLVFAARDAGLEVASGLANGGNTSGNADQQIDTIKSTLVDTFLRQPTQLINFGVVLDAPDNNGKCVKEFDEAYAATPDGPGVMDKVQEKVGDILPGAGAALDLLNPDDKPEDRIKDAIAACDGDDGPMKQYADNPGPGQAMGLLFLIFAGTLLMLFAIYLAGRLVLAAGVSIGNAIKSIPGIVVAIAPSMRGQFWRTIANVAMSLLQMMFSIVFLVGYVLVVQDLFASDESNLIRTVFFVDIFLIVALLLFRRAIKGLQRMSDSLASILAKRPDAAPTSITRSTPTSGRDIALMAAQGRQIYRGGKAAVQGAGKIAKKATTSTKAVGSVAGTATSTAVTGGVAAAVWAGTKAVSGAKKAKKSIDNLSDPATMARSQSSGSRSSTSSPSRGTGADSAAAAVRSRLSKSAVADKPGIKKSIATAPSGLAPERGQVRSSASKTVAPDGRAFREFTTDSGAPLLLPTTPTRAPKAPKPTAAPARPPAAPVVPAVNIPTGSGSRTAGLMAAAAQAGAGNARTPQPSSLTRRPR
ncbi:hypothetical protein RQN9TF_31540 (plasmid) [Rhodococcus qingshengii]|uniref:hypothetical protein n=1 Tax=Rhodococcus TaxID=1827 RepID=UPI000F61B9F0|nr:MULTISPECIES: hypothetical protein [Rhodococcus]AZI65845.1 hypothetical protein EHW12_32695 [Rhodococcus sp. NJ-530]BDQ23789.1 hypothetical protein RQN9TF_31540 [Rhodococcus qingshengii]